MKKKVPIIILSVIIALIFWFSVTLSGEYYTVVEVPVRLVSFERNHGAAVNFPENLTVKVKGKGWNLLNLYTGRDLQFNISMSGIVGKKTIRPVENLSENGWLTGNLQILDIQPSSFEITTELLKKIKVPVKVQTDVTFKDGYGLARRPKVTPDSVTVIGTPSLLANLKSLRTVIYDDRELNELTSVPLQLEPVQGIDISPQTVVVDFDVQKVVDRRIEGVKINVTGIPADRAVVLIPEKVDVTVRGGINILSKLTEKDFYSEIDYKIIYTDTLGVLMPNIILPDHVTLVETRPQTIRFTIKKFQ